MEDTPMANDNNIKVAWEDIWLKVIPAICTVLIKVEGLSLDANTGEISGIVTTGQSNQPITVTLLNNGGSGGSRDYIEYLIIIIASAKSPFQLLTKLLTLSIPWKKSYCQCEGECGIEFDG